MYKMEHIEAPTGKELCNLACNPSLDGYTPNPLYQAGYCPDYMHRQCNADGSMFEEQWETHQENIKDYNARKIMSMTFGIRPQEYQYQSPSHVQRSQGLPPSTAEVYQAMYSAIPTHPAINTLPKKRSSLKKKTLRKKSSSKKSSTKKSKKSNK